ncbi:MAG: hypothetical protein M0Z61_00635 [Nitrospiraceae bacterium]|nr:hypothetical protein [Nitrospiraceae bacterium]
MELRKINILETSIIIPENLRDKTGNGINAKKEELISQIISSSGSNLFYPLIFLESSTKPTQLKLVARHWAFAGYIKREQYVVDALIIKDEELIPGLIACDERETDWLFKGQIKGKSAKGTTTADREESRRSGRICPLCHGVLRRPLRKKDREQDDGYLIVCENNVKDMNSKSHGKKCQFSMILTSVEIEKFKNKELNITEILRPLDACCIRCKGQVYERRVIKKSGITSTLRCINYYSPQKCKPQ